MKEINWSATYQIAQLNELSESDQLLIEKAQRSREQAYAPYSRYKVGAAALLDNGEVFLGNNQENAAYPSGLCAERVALFSAGAQFPSNSIVSLAIFTNAHGDVPATSCGSCRQVMSEFEQRQESNIRVLFCDSDENVLISSSVRDILPFSFEGKRLG